MRKLSLLSMMLGLSLSLLAQSKNPLPNDPADPTSPAGGAAFTRAPVVPKAPMPRLPDRTPDLSGVWHGGGPIQDLAAGLAPGETIPLLPEAKKLMASRQSKDDPEANCLPTGVPRIAPYPWRIVQTPSHAKATHLFFLFEGNIHSYRQIFMDGRKHPENLDPTWYGHSVGRWEGDTLVVDVVHFNDQTRFDKAGNFHSEMLHVVERYSFIDPTHLNYEVTLEDPKVFTRPWKMQMPLYKRLETSPRVLEYYCYGFSDVFTLPAGR